MANGTRTRVSTAQVMTLAIEMLRQPDGTLRPQRTVRENTFFEALDILTQIEDALDRYDARRAN